MFFDYDTYDREETVLKYPSKNRKRPGSESRGKKRETITFTIPKPRLPKIKLPGNLSPRTILISLFALVIVVTAAIIISSLPKKPSSTDPAVPPDNTENAEITEPDYDNTYKYEYYKFDPGVMTEYRGAVEFLSLHPVIAYPEMAYDNDSFSRRFDSWSLTANEFKNILQSLYDNKYIIINPNQVWSEYTADNGSVRMQKNKLSIPEGRKPIVLIFNDFNYYESTSGNGYSDNLCIRTGGEIWDTTKTPTGGTAITQEHDAITILDTFVKEHPDFSLHGAKGCIALTGYEGILGYRTQNGDDDSARKKEIAAVKPVISQLKKTGWYFACHTYSHTDIASAAYTDIVSDMTKWVNEVGSLVGETKILVAPDSGAPDGTVIPDKGETYDYLQSLGFKYYFAPGTGTSSEIKTNSPAVFCSVTEIDGDALRRNDPALSKFFNISEVFDGDVRPAAAGSIPGNDD